MKQKLDKIAQSLLDRVTEFELKKAEQRQRHSELEGNARQARDTKKAASKAYQARQALKHPDLLTTSTKAAKRAAARRLQKAEEQAFIAMLEDWKCRLIAEFAAEDLAAFEAIEASGQNLSESAPRSQTSEPKALPEDPKLIAPSFVSDLEQSGSEEAAPRVLRPNGSSRKSNRPIVTSGPDPATKSARKTATAEADFTSRNQAGHSAHRMSDQEILPPIGGRNEYSDNTQKDLF